MHQYTTTILKFSKQGEKTGWTYIEIPADVAQAIFPGNKKSFRVKGKLDDYKFSGVSLLPMGEGNFIMPLKADVRKKIGKREGAMLKVELQHDKSEYSMNADFMECLNDDPEAKKFFDKFPGSHQRYFSKWIDDAKSIETKAKRIATAVNALARGMNYTEMIRAQKK